MLRTTRDIRRFGVSARDGACGRIDDFYIDSARWELRYLVLDTGRWIPGRRVLVPAPEIRRADCVEEVVSLRLPSREISGLPGVDADPTVSRQQVLRALEHLQESEGAPIATWMAGSARMSFGSNADPSLHSVHEILSYGVEAEDGSCGQVHDLVLDVETWAVRFLVVDIRSHGDGKLVLVAPFWVGEISWLSVAVHVRMRRQAVEDGPELYSSLPETAGEVVDLRTARRRNAPVTREPRRSPWRTSTR